MKTNITSWLPWAVIALLVIQVFTDRRAEDQTRTLTDQLDSLHLVTEQLIRLQQDYETATLHLQDTRAQAASVQATLHQLANEQIHTLTLLQMELQRLLATYDTLVAPSYSSTDSLLFQP
jgi:hypothetical protein